jgi:hypothetical protein
MEFDLYPQIKYKRVPPHKEVVEIRRIWTRDGRVLLRVHPVRGGKELVCGAEWFEENFERHDNA